MANTIDEIIILDSDGEDKIEESPTKEQMITETVNWTLNFILKNL